MGFTDKNRTPDMIRIYITYLKTFDIYEMNLDQEGVDVINAITNLALNRRDPTSEEGVDMLGTLIARAYLIGYMRGETDVAEAQRLAAKETTSDLDEDVWDIDLEF